MLPVWPAHQPRRFPGETSVGGPIAAWQNRRREKTVSPRYATKFEIRGKMEEKIKWRGQNESRIVGEEKKVADLLVLPRPKKRVQNGAGFSGKT